MKLVFIFLIILLLNNCSLNKDSKYWTEDVVKKSEDQKKLSEVLKKSKDITNMTIEEAQKLTLEFLSHHADKGRSPLCGNSISHDRRFLRRYMPEVDAFFHYRNVDVSSIKELIKRWNPELLDGFRKSGGHRAMGDVLESIEELKFYRDKFFL